MGARLQLEGNTVKNAIINIGILFALAACSGGESGELFEDTPDGGEPVGQAAQPWRARPATTGRATWGVRQNTGNACVDSGSSFNCYFIGQAAGSHAIAVYVSGTACDWGCGSTKATLEADIDLYASTAYAFLVGVANLPWSIYRVSTAAQANVIFEPLDVPYSDNYIGNYGAVQWATGACFAASEPVSIINTYHVCNIQAPNYQAPVKVKYDPVALYAWMVNQGYSGPQQVAGRQHGVNNLMHQVVGLGVQGADHNTQTWPYITGTAKVFASLAEKCRWKAFQRDPVVGQGFTDYRLSTPTCD